MDNRVPDQKVAVYGEDEPQYDGHYDAEERDYGSIDKIDNSAGIKHDSSSSAGYFGKLGEITDSVIVMDKISGRPCGFGFVTFADAEVADKVLQEEHVIDGRAVEVKRTVPREDKQGRGGVSKTRKIFVGGLPLSLSEDDLRDYLSSYGDIVEHQIMLDHKTNRSRGFGFVTFDNEDAVEKILSEGRMQELGGKLVEIKKAEAKRSGFDNSNEGRFHRGSSSARLSGNFAGGSEGFGGGYGGKMGRGGYVSYGSYGGYGNFPGNYAGGAQGYYAGYGGYGYGYGFGGSMYGGGAYGGGGSSAPVGCGGAASYGVGKGYGGGCDGGEGFGGGGSGGCGPVNSYGGGAAGGAGGRGGYGGSKVYGNDNGTSGRFHPYRK